MKRRSKLTLAAIGVAIVAIGLGAVLFQPRPSGTRNDMIGNKTIASDNATEPKTMIKVISTASAFPFVQRWASQYNNDQAAANLQVSYLEGAETAGAAAEGPIGHRGLVGPAGGDGDRDVGRSGGSLGVGRSERDGMGTD